MPALAMKRVAVAVPAAPRIATVFNLADPKERAVFDVIQSFYGPTEHDRLHAIRKGTQQVRPVAVTLGSFQPQRQGTSVEWTVAVWYIDAIEVRMFPCKSRHEARRLFDTV
jgi:hypothetical protein